jgi:hypothetical protein
MIRIPREYGLISVDSAFGGFAIYKTRDFMFHDYTRFPRDSHSDIDHVIFNRRIIESGGQETKNFGSIFPSIQLPFLNSSQISGLILKLNKSLII